jgi:hypothetical protein
MLVQISTKESLKLCFLTYIHKNILVIIINFNQNGSSLLSVHGYILIRLPVSLVLVGEIDL